MTWGWILLAYIAPFSLWATWKFWKAGSNGGPTTAVAVWSLGLIALLFLSKH